MWVYGLDWMGPGQRQVVDACECGNELPGSLKCGEFLDQLQTSQLLKKDSATWSKYLNIMDWRINIYCVGIGDCKSACYKCLAAMCVGNCNPQLAVLCKLITAVL